MNLIELIVASLMLIVCILAIQYSFLLPAKKGLPVLMYHKVLEHGADGLTVTTDQFDLQMMYLKEKGYHTINFRTLKNLLKEGAPLPKKTVVITFDDAYRNFYDHALPVLKKYQFKATVFVPVAFIGKTNLWDKGSEPIMNADQLKRLALQEETEIGIHSFLHRSYGDMAIPDMEEDLNNCMETLAFYGIPFESVLAYPYGGYPKRDPVLKAQMIECFTKLGFSFALRIGNRINPWPIRQPFEIKRIDIKGTDSFFIFRTKLKKGHAKLFA